ncbi:MAG: hypothetical protein KOO62_06885 [candidate division Zixibacteria bacterium]|nr:hypothetical protein [candidate division Zixibacteria bacterium]
MNGNVSQKQIEANRRNAQFSTGPKTDEGKQCVRFNALKHGLLARTIVAPSRNNHETQAAFDNLLGAFREELRPEGLIEEMLVEEIAVCYWRQQRAIRVEAGEIQQLQDRCGREDDNAYNDTLALPNDSDVYKITRYETAIEHRLHRALTQLDRRQKSRRKCRRARGI